MNTEEVTSGADELLELAGFALAHALWSISDGEPLCTLALTDRDDQGRVLYRFEADSISESVEVALDKLNEPDLKEFSWAIVCDGYYTSDNQKRDALIVIPRPVRRMPFRVIQQYKPANNRHGFKVLGKPILLNETGAIYESDQQQASLLKGIHQHLKVHELLGQWQDKQ